VRLSDVRVLWTSVLAVTLMASACASDPTTSPRRAAVSGHASAAAATAAIDPQAWVTLPLAGWASVEAPARWSTTTYRGYPAPVYFPLRFVSSDPLTGPCASGRSKSACATQNWFPDGWRTPADGVLVLWSHAEFPGSAGPALSHQPGRRTTIDDRPAKVRAGAATPSCPDGAATELDVSVREVAHSYPGDRFDLRACFGPAAPAADHAAVRRMARSLHVLM
jgi:hypothetical protein